MRRAFFFVLFLHCSMTGMGKALDFVLPPPDTIKYTGSATVCEGGTILLSADPAPPSGPYQWKLDNVDIPGARSSAYTANKSGTYTVSVGSILYKALNVKINPVINADFTFTDNICSGANAPFVSNVTGGTAPYTYSWTFGDGATSATPNPGHIFTSAAGCGSEGFLNFMTVRDAAGCSKSVSKRIQIQKKPDVSVQDEDVFTPFSNCDKSPTASDPDFTLTIRNISPGAACISSYAINWGDGEIQTGLTAASFPLTHLYTKVGAFNLTVSGMGSNGCSGSKTYVVANQSNPAGSLGTLGSTTNLCIPAVVPFTIGNWQINSPGTTYILDFGDGASDTLIHPLNATSIDQVVSHTYTKGSCPQPSYIAVLQVINACDITPYSAGNIQIRDKPNVSLSDPLPSCAGKAFCFDNKTIPGSYGPNCSDATEYTWDFGDGTAVSKEKSPCHIFATPGSYTVNLTASNPCGTSGTSIPVCATAAPVPAFTLGSETGCAPFTTIATNTTVLINNCSAPNYHWTISYEPAFCGTVPGWDFAAGSTDSSISPSFIFTNPGTYIVKLEVTNSCGTFETNDTVTVKQAPVVSLPPISNSCDPINLTPVAGISSCGSEPLTFLWNFGSGIPATSSSEVPGPVLFEAPGLHAISLQVTNECGATTATEEFSIDDISQSVAGPAQLQCGTTVTMAANAAISGSGIWSQISGPNTASIFSPSSPSTAINGLIAGAYVFRWTISNGSCSNFSDVAITMLAGETAIAGPDQNICAQTSVTLAANASAIPDSASWTYVSGPSGSVFTSASSPTTTVTGLTTGVYVFRWTIKNNVCPASTDDVQITIDEPATPSVAGVDQNKCGTTTTMEANTPLIGTGSWTIVAGPNTPAIVSPSLAATAITGLVPGAYTFQWTISNGSCSSSSNVSVVIADGASLALAGPDQNLCLDTVATLAANLPAVGSGTWTSVSGSAGHRINDVSSPATTVSGLVPGNYVFRWTINFSTCAVNTDDVSVTIFDTPTVAFAGEDQVVCASNATLSGNIPVTGIGSWSLVSGPNSPAISLPSAPETTVSGMIAGTYLFKWSIINRPCVDAEDTVRVIVTGITGNALTADQQICMNTSAAIIEGSTPSGGNGTYTFQWQKSIDNGNSWEIIAGAIGKDYDPGILTETTCYRRGVTTIYCSDTSGTFSTPVCITVNPDAKAVFSMADSLVCPHVSLDTLISVTAFADRNLQYSWYVNNIFISGNTTGEAPVFTLNEAGQTFTVKLVTLSKFGCRADSISMTLKTLPAVTASFIKDIQQGCGPLQVTFTNTSDRQDSSIKFFWDFGNGAPVQQILQPTPTIFFSSTLFKDTVYHITLKAFSGCDTTTWIDSVKVLADPQARFISSSNGCSPFKDIITNNSVGNNQVYYWDFGDGTTDTTFANGNFLHNYSTGFVDTFAIRLVAQNICARDTQVMNLVVSPNSIQSQVSINGSQLFGCAPHTVEFLNSSSGASVLNFNFGDGTAEESIPNNQSGVTHIFLHAGIDTIRIQLLNDCTDTTIFKYVTVYAAPVASFSIDNSVICTGNSVTTTNTSQNANSYEWIWGDGATTSSENSSHSYSKAGMYSLKLVARKLNSFGTVCYDTSEATIVQVVDRIPPVIAIANGSRCVPFTITVSAEGAENAAVVEWYFYDSQVAPGIFRVTGSTASYTYNHEGVDSVKLLVENVAGCKDSTIEQFTIQKTPAIAFTPFYKKTCNTDTTLVFNVTLDYDGNDPVNYEWYINDELTGVSNPFSHQFEVAAGNTATNDFTIKVLVKNSFGCGDTAVFGKFTIQTLAPQHIFVAPSYVLEQPNYTFTFTDTSVALNNTTYLWDPGDRNLQQLSGREIKYTYGDTGKFKVTLLVTDYETGCTQSDSTNVTILSVPGYLYVPNAFCPGCQKAELRNFLPLGKGLKDYRLSIYNIYGQKIFETTHLDANGVPDEPWNGNWPNQKNAQQDAYSWHIEAHFINGTEWKGMNNEKSGFITIIR